jgi:hydrocephalus-inducing protein
VLADSFTGQFEALVRGGNGDSRALRFGVEGVGTLPAVMVDGVGFERNKSNGFSLNLGRTLLGFSKDKFVRIVNEGMIEAIAVIVIKPNPDFVHPSPEALKAVPIPAAGSWNLPITFKPDKLRRSQLDMTITVADNPKLVITVSLSGEGSSEDVVFEGLSGDDAEIVFKDCIVGRQQQAVFTMHNMGANDVRFLRSTIPGLMFAPKVGHLHVNHAKTIVASFFSDHPSKPASAKINCQIQKIEFIETNPPEWDDTMKVMKFVPRKLLHAEPEKTPPKGRRKPAPIQIVPPKDDSADAEFVRITELREEPSFTILQGKGKEMSLKVTTIADHIKYQLDTTEITFLPTMMFEKRTTECKMSNPSTIRFEYHWRVAKFVALRSDYAHLYPPPFAIEPGSGIIEPGQTTTFRVLFMPLEVDDFTGQLVCDIPYLSQMEPPIITNNYYYDYTMALPDDVKVIELFSKGIGQKIIKKFELVNPTSSPYEMNWQYMGQEQTPVLCETPNGLISSGRRSPVLFSYVLVSVKTVESLWEFQIPEMEIRVPFLFVGRIMQ